MNIHGTLLITLLLLSGLWDGSFADAEEDCTAPAAGGGKPQMILVTGAVGQIGSELVAALRKEHGGERVVATGRKTAPGGELRDGGPFHFVDVTNATQVNALFARYDFTQVYHMAAILSGVGEKRPQLAWRVNMDGLINVLEAVRAQEAQAEPQSGTADARGSVRVMVPSSIAAFGPDAPRDAPQDTAMHPTSMYGVTKVAGELLADYYCQKYGMDVRGVRLPGIVSAETLPGGGTTDYAVEIFYEAVKAGRYKCFLSENTALPMMYMPDCLHAMVSLMAAERSRLEWPHAAMYNVNGFKLTPAQLASAIQAKMPGFEVEYEPDFRQAIADSWPDTMDDSAARKEWDWKPRFGVQQMTDDMLERLGKRHARGEL